mgnify:CR=1 FL=1
MKYLIDAGANVNTVGELQGNALHNACCWNTDESYQVVQLLLKYGANINQINGAKQTALHVAASKKKNVKLLKNSGLQVIGHVKPNCSEKIPELMVAHFPILLRLNHPI